MDSLGKAILAGLAGIVVWKNVGDEDRRKITGLLGDLAGGIADVEREKRARHEVMVRELENLRAEKQKWLMGGIKEPEALQFVGGLKNPPPSPTSMASLLQLGPIVDADARWREVIVPPSEVLILGKRGSGKSALGYRLLELFRYQLTPYVVGVPDNARKLLPDWIGIVPTLEELPLKTIALIDEAYLHYHARGSMAKESKAMSQNINLSGQKDQTLIFVSQEARQVDRNISSSASVVIFKDLGILQLEFDRPELRKLTIEASEMFSKISGDRRRWSYVYSPDSDFMGMLENELASFWVPKLSRMFTENSKTSVNRAPIKSDPPSKARLAKQLRAKGYSYSQIASELGVSKGTVLNYLKNYPYSRDGATDLTIY